MKEKENEKILAENINNIAKEEGRKLSLYLDKQIEIEESSTQSLKLKELKYEKEKSQDEISKKRDYIKDF